MNVKTDKPILIIPVGAPGAGKNHWINEINEKLVNYGFEDEQLVSVIEMDAIRAALPKMKKGEPVPQMFNKRVAEFAKDILQDVLAYRKPTVYNATNLKSEYINSLLSLAEESGYEPIFVTFDVPLEILLERNTTRPKEDRVDETIVNGMYKNYQKLINSSY